MKSSNESKQSIRSQQNQLQNNLNSQNSPKIPQNLEQPSPPIIPEHLQNPQQIQKICKESIKKLLDSGLFSWEEEFRGHVDVQVLETDFQWIRVKLRYGNYGVEVKVIYTEIFQRVFEDGREKCGGFGVVRFLQYQQVGYAVKGIPIQYRQNQINIDNVYKQYFLCSIAGILQTAPKILPLFGYDILLTKSMAFFCMQQCAPTAIAIEQEQMIGYELVNHLKVMHSLGFIHSDIKPENVGYCLSFGKCVFLDFGLSRFVKQAVGMKTMTSFTGTISYCSEQMKKCYFLKKPTYVDLYANDAWCLQKTIRTIKFVKTAPNFMQQQSQSSQNFPRQPPILHHIIQILRLKYSIHQQNLPQILHLLQTSSHPRTILQIFSSAEISPSISLNENVRQKLEEIRREIGSVGVDVDVDALLFQFFCKEKRVMSAERIIPIGQIMSADSGFFQRYLEKPELVLKLLLFLDPLSNGHSGNPTNKYKLKRTIIQKIYDLKNICPKSPIFLSEKTRFALLYLHKNLKQKKTLSSLCCLRILFISLQQWSIAERLQNQIIDMIEQPLLRLLKIVEFGMFRSCFLWNFGRIYWGWLEVVGGKKTGRQRSERDSNGMNSNASENRSREFLEEDFGEFRRKAIDIFNLVITSRLLPSFTKQLNKHKQKMLQQIDKIAKACHQTSQKSSILNIKYFFLYMCKQIYQNSSKNFPQSIQSKIYHRSWNRVSLQLTGQEQEQEKIFWPVRFQCQNQFQRVLGRKEIGTVMRNYFQVMKERNQVVVDFIHVVLSVNYYEKEHLYFFIKRIQEFLLNQEAIKAASSCGNQEISELSVQKGIASVNLYMQLLLRNSRQAEQAEKIENNNKIQLINQLQHIFNRFIQIQKIKCILISSSHLKIDVMITQIKFQLSQGHSTTQTKLAIENLVKLLDPFPSQNIQLVQNFFTLYNYLQQEVPKLENHYSQDILLGITEQYINHQNFEIFQNLRRIPQDYVRICNERGLEDRSLKIILDLIAYYQSKNGSCTVRLDMEIFTKLVTIYCNTLSVQILLERYLWMRKERKEFEDGFFSYLIFSMFIRIRTFVNQLDQLKQVTVTTLCLSNMPCLFRTKAKPEIIRLYKYVMTFKSKRKMLINRRLQIRNTLNDKKIKTFIKELSNKVEKICLTHKNFQHILSRLNEKIQNFGKL